MNASGLWKLLRHSSKTRCLFRRCVSHLVSAGDLGENKVLVLKPELDFDAILRSPESLAANLVRRGAQPDVSQAGNIISELDRRWKDFRTDKETVELLEREKSEVKERMAAGGPSCREDMARINQKLTPIKKRHWESQRSLLPLLIHLPNELHDKTPNECRILNNYCVANPWQKLLGGGLSFTGVGRRSMKPCGHFLLGEAAFAEIEMTQQCRDAMTALAYHPVSPPDTVTSSVSEATYGLQGMDELLKIKTDDSYLPGSASLAAMCALFARRSTRPEVGLPMKLFSTGTVYDHLGEKTGCGILTLMADKGEQAADEEFEASIRAVVEAVVNFGCNCRTVAAPAPDLAPRQRRRVDVEILLEPSVWKKVGYVEDCSDYVSRRMLMKYQRRGDEGNYYLMVVYGFLSITDMIMSYVSLK